MVRKFKLDEGSVVELVKRLLSTSKVSGSNPRESKQFSKTNCFENHFEYFSAKLSQVCIQHHDELGRLVAGLTT